MEPIPDAWPPDESAQPRVTVPLFPLTNVWLFPGALLPLHVFEPRYRQMIEDILDGPGRIVMGTVAKGHESELQGTPPIYPVAGLGEIVNHERLGDGRFHIRLFGLGRVLVTEAESDRDYRQVIAEPLVERPISKGDESDLRPRLLEAVRDEGDRRRRVPDGVPFTTLVDLLLLQLDLPHDKLQRLFSEPDPVRRALGALSEHDA